jgi:signal peptidase II
VLFGMLLGGTTGNLTDRLFREPSFGQGHVIDFLQVWGFPAIFNFADSFIVASMGLFIILTVRGIGLDGKRVVHPVPESIDAGPADADPSGPQSHDQQPPAEQPPAQQ